MTAVNFIATNLCTKFFLLISCVNFPKKKKKKRVFVCCKSRVDTWLLFRPKIRSRSKSSTDRSAVESDKEFECVSVLHGHTQDVKAIAWHPELEVRTHSLEQLLYICVFVYVYIIDLAQLNQYHNSMHQPTNGFSIDTCQTGARIVQLR